MANDDTAAGKVVGSWVLRMMTNTILMKTIELYVPPFSSLSKDLSRFDVNYRA
jgi:hypothetical protein